MVRDPEERLRILIADLDGRSEDDIKTRLKTGAYSNDMAPHVEVYLDKKERARRNHEQTIQWLILGVAIATLIVAIAALVATLAK